MYQPTAFEEELCQEIVDCAFQVHKQLGPVLLEKIYEACFCYELKKKAIAFERQKSLPIFMTIWNLTKDFELTFMLKK